MIPLTYIKRNIRTIGARYKSSKNPLHTVLYAKLAIIEVGGWVEMSMDDLVIRAGARLKQPKNIKQFQEDIIGKTWGFEYTKNFRKMLIQTIGLVTVEIVEGHVDGGKFAKMLAAIALLKTARNNVAHTYVKKISPTAPIPSPVVAATYLNDIYIGLKDIEAALKAKKVL